MNGLLCAATYVILLNLRLQNCGWPLQGCVFVGIADVDVDVAVLFCRVVPFNAVEVVETLEPTSNVVITDDVKPVSVPVACEVIIVVSERSMRYSVDPVLELIDLYVAYVRSVPVG
jgi:hypothetical protein